MSSGIASDAAGEPPRSRRKRLLLSFQRPSLPCDVKKPPTRARGLMMLTDLTSYPSASEGAPVSSLQGLSYAALLGSRGMIAPLAPLATLRRPSSGRNAASQPG